jgi:ribokinase
MFNLLTIGDMLIDTHIMIDNATLECDLNQHNCQLCLNYAAKIPISDSFQALGGNAANMSLAAVKLGLTTSVLTSLGKDTNGEIIKKLLKKYKINTKFLVVDKNTKTRYSVVLNFKKERTILSAHQKRTYKFPAKFSKTNWIYYTSLSEGYEPLQKKLLQFLNKNRDILLAYNPGSLQLQNLNLVKEVLLRTDLLILNLEEAKMVLGTPSDQPTDTSFLIKKLQNLGAKEVVITDGERGAWAGDDTQIWHCESFPVEVVAKNGAGDAFSAGYVAARFYKKPIDTALSWGIANSSSVISTHGPEKNLLTQKEIAKAISKFSSIKPVLILSS